jgi:hydroxylamine dehydrogenase
MKKITICFFFISMTSLFFFHALSATNGEKTSAAVLLSKETETCIECHRIYSPGIVADWQKSRHATTAPKDAISKPALQRRISAETVPQNLAGVAVGCYECHSLNSAAHKDNFDHFDLKINVIVSPNDCKICHEKEAEEYGRSKKAHALSNLDKNPVYSMLVDSITSIKMVKGGKMTTLGPSENTKNETCYACHGTEVKLKGMKKIATDLGDIEVPDLTNLPNHGVGRVNPDGSRGACSACHARHSFSIEVARKPYTCSQCHLEPDIPAYNVYMESKHGNIFSSQHQQWKFDTVPWVIGKDFNAPTCATCHNSLVVNENGDVIQNRNHDFGSRLWVRIFGLIYSHPQPKDGRTYLIKNKDGLPLPTTFGGELALDYLIDKGEQEKRLAAMEKTCRACHSRSWTEGHFTKFNLTVAETDKMVATSTIILADAWKKGLANRKNPFDEKIEHLWIKEWLFYGNSVRYGSAMSGPDYTAFKNGWWDLTTNLEKMRSTVYPLKK